MEFQSQDWCPVCGEKYTGIEPRCRVCDNWRGPPNVLLVLHNEEQVALQQRYDEAAASAAARGVITLFQDFQARAKTSFAVLNCSVEWVIWFFSMEENLYATYYDQIKGGTRRPSSMEFDRHRAAVDSILYGTFAGDIRFAALSLDGRGLVSYGPVSLQLKEVAIAERATVLEENAYHFVKRYGLAPGSVVPPGHMASWGQRDVLASAKVEPVLSTSTVEANFPNLLLHSDGDRERDRFIEVHIFGPFNHRAVERVLVARSLVERKDRALIHILKERVQTSGASWGDV